MKRAVAAAVLATAFSIACAQANAACGAVPNDVEAYLQSVPSWTPVRVEDLIEDDRSLWQQANPGLCPGLAIVDLDGKGRENYALALLKRTNDRMFEKLVVVRRKFGRLMAQTIVPPKNVLGPLVVWRISPGRIDDWERINHVTLRHDGIVYEKMEAAAQVYYLINGHFRSILTSD